MISIIICSRTAEISKEQLTNIEKTIDCDYELITIDNSKNELTIFEAYNIGVKKSKGSVLGFMHDDIFFHTQNWGTKVMRYFEDNQIGALGVAGSPYSAKMPGSWWAGDLVDQQLLTNKDGNLTLATKFHDNEKSDFKDVAVLDGIWMCIRKSLFEEISFDSINFIGYHFYDIDICLQISRLGYKLRCVFDIEIEHISEGNVNEQWIKNAFALQKKWRSLLPIQAVTLTKVEKNNAEFKTLKEFTQILMANNYSERYSYKLAIKEILRNGIDIFSYKESLFFVMKYIKSL
ncbi:MAG: glycosyltransferase [Pedobacter agri]